MRRRLAPPPNRNRALDAALGVRERADPFAGLREGLTGLLGRLRAAFAPARKAPARKAPARLAPAVPAQAVRREPVGPRGPRWDATPPPSRRAIEPAGFAVPRDHAHARWDQSDAGDGRGQPGLALEADPDPRWDDRPLDLDHQSYPPDAYGHERRWDEPGRDEPLQEADPWQQAEPAPEWQPRERELPQGYLAVEGIEKSFGSRKVVKGVSLYVRRGEAVGLLGPNGAGKTTIFYMVTGLIKADRGRVELDGNDITALPMYQRGRLGIGYLAQEASIFRGLTVEENIRGILEVVEPSRKKREAELDALLDEFNIARLRKTPAPALSGGERRRVEIARALASRPTYMLLDEPFAGIDPIAVGDIQALVRHLTQRGIGVLITDHNVRETLGLTDRAYIIYSGEVLTEGNTADIVNNPDVRRLYLGEEFRL
jgi:lipopolysaccharide export system ATP-binding protein